MSGRKSSPCPARFVCVEIPPWHRHYLLEPLHCSTGHGVAWAMAVVCIQMMAQMANIWSLFSWSTCALCSALGYWWSRASTGEFRRGSVSGEGPESRRKLVAHAEVTTCLSAVCPLRAGSAPATSEPFPFPALILLCDSRMFKKEILFTEGTSEEPGCWTGDQEGSVYF